MTPFFAPTVPAEKVNFDKLRVHRVPTDTMEPSLRGGRDYVLVAPVDTYQGEGMYLIDDGLAMVLYRVSPNLDGRLRLWLENPWYRDHVVDREAFNNCVIGIVVADIKVRDERFLNAA